MGAKKKSWGVVSLELENIEGIGPLLGGGARVLEGVRPVTVERSGRVTYSAGKSKKSTKSFKRGEDMASFNSLKGGDSSAGCGEGMGRGSWGFAGKKRGRKRGRSSIYR